MDDARSPSRKTSSSWRSSKASVSEAKRHDVRILPVRSGPCAHRCCCCCTTHDMESGWVQMKHIVNRLPENDEERSLTQHLTLDDPSCGITDDEVAVEIMFCRKTLRSLDVSGVSDTSDRTIVQLARTVPGLRGLKLTGCRLISDVSAHELVAAAPPLQCLYVGGGVVLTDSAVSAIARTLSKLTELDLSDGPLITAVSMRDVWTYSRKLTRLSLARCVRLTDAAFPHRVKDRERRVGPEDKPLPHRPVTCVERIEPLMLRHTAVDMQMLDLSGCTNITDEAVMGLVVHCPLMRRLSVAGCTGLTNRGVESIASLGVNLAWLNLAHLPQITDQAIVTLVRGCPHLRSLDVACR